MPRLFSSGNKATINQGHHSSLDRLQSYRDNQERWSAFCDEAVNQLVELLPSFPEQRPPLSDHTVENIGRREDYIFNTVFGCAYAFLADQRWLIATELKHKSDVGLTDSFGSFRDESARPSETVFASNEPLWSDQKDKIFELCRDLVKPIMATDEDDVLNCGDYTLMRESDISMKISEDDDVVGDMYVITILSPFPRRITRNDMSELHTKQLSSIMYFDAKDDKSLNRITILYSRLNEFSVRGDYLLADDYVEKCRAATDTRVFLEGVGRLSHLLVHILPVDRGNSAIIEMFIKALAKEKGIELGPFNYEEHIGWDFKALLTPNREEYAKWYAEHAYVNVQQHSAASANRSKNQ